MEGTATLALTAERQRRFLRLLQEDGKERIFLREVLGLVRQTAGADSVGVYLPAEEGWQSCVELGPDDFPDLLPAGVVPQRPFRQVAGGLLVATSPLPAELPEPLELLLAVGMRLCRLRSSLQRHDFDRKYRGVELEAIYDVGLAVASTLDLGALGEEILLRAVSLLDARRGGLYLAAGDRLALSCTIGGSAAPELDLDADPEREEVLPGATHLLAVPVEIDGAKRGELVVADKESRFGVGPFDEGDRRSLAHFANQAALALEQARLHQEALEKERLEREMQLASQIQRGILPRQLPPVPGYELHAWTRPARHVGGDYYDAVPLAEGRLALLVADVSGKGVPAALLVSTLHALLRLLLQRGADHDEVGRHLNRHLLEFSAANKFATLLLVALEPGSGRLDYLNAGHNPGLVVREAGGVEELPAGGVPLGLLPDVPFQSAQLDLAAGDLLCIYSDGVTEASGDDEEEFGSERLAELLQRHRAAPLAQVRAAIDEAVSAWAAGHPQGDDQTVVLLRRVV